MRAQNYIRVVPGIMQTGNGNEAVGMTERGGPYIVFTRELLREVHPFPPGARTYAR